MEFLATNDEAFMSVLTMIGSVVASLWGYVQASGIYQAGKKKKIYKVIQALESGVEKTYQDFVQDIKRSREDGKLTANEINKARGFALKSAENFARADGINAAQLVGRGYLEVLLSQVVSKAKKGEQAKT